MEKYVLVVGGCGWDCTFNQLKDGRFPKSPDHEAPGSKGSNQAVGVAKAGAKCKIISAVGTDVYGDKIIKNLENYNIDTIGVAKINDCGSDRCDIYVDFAGNNKMLRAPGSIGHINARLIEKNENLIKNASCVVLQSKMSREAYVKLIDLCCEFNVPTVFTPCPFQDLILSGEKAQENLELLKKVTYITANKHEALSITGASKVEEAFKILGNLVITAGPRGVFFLDGNGKLQNSPSLKPRKIVDKTGAGDAFCAFFTAGLYYHGMSVVESVELGIKGATLKLEGKGAQSSIPTLDDVNNRDFELDEQTDIVDDPDLHL